MTTEEEQKVAKTIAVLSAILFKKMGLVIPLEEVKNFYEKSLQDLQQASALEETAKQYDELMIQLRSTLN